LIGKRKFGYQPFEPDILIWGDYDFNNAENLIKIIETSGHSEDSISVCLDDEIAIVGDAMFGVFKNAIFPPYADNTDKMIKSWHRLLNTNCNIFLPGHGNEITRALLKNQYDKYTRKHNN